MANVLIIEDNAANMKLACLLLRHATHSVMCAVDAETGLTLARDNQPDLILMDLQLPGMDGLAATALLKKDPLTAAIPVIALTALAMKADQEKCHAAGCDGYIAKPLRYQELYAAINALLDNGTAPAAVGEIEPAIARTAAPTPDAVHTTATAFDPRLILVAEDNEVNQKLILRQLALLGFAANIAGNGRLALERWQSGQYAMLITDLQMPEMNGYALARAVRAQEAGAERRPIIALTASMQSTETDQCRAAGMDDCLSKPLQLARLKASLAQWLPALATAPASAGDDGTSPGTTSALDLGVLERAIGRDPKAIRGFLIDFRDSAQAQAAQLISACNSGKGRLCFELAHKLKSSSRAVGAAALGDLCARIESAGRSGNREILSSLVPLFEHLLDTVNDAIERFVSRPAEASAIP